ncbi:putative quinone oxidoreductase [Bisporella sp. PMI_857]|nr:putative quinone oxidoreductase [Bisporella sp. PMI_857]
MNAVVLKEVGAPEQLTFIESLQLPKLTEGFVLVKNTYAGINYEAAGIVEATAGSYGIEKGDRVVWIYHGAYAKYTAVPAQQCIKIPEGVTDEDAVAAFLTGMTALSLVKEAFVVKKGQTVLLHAAAGALGLLMCQILRDVGATVIGTTGGPEKCALAEGNGAAHVIDYTATSGLGWVAQVQKITNGEGPDVVYDTVGRNTWEGSLDVVKAKGKVVFLGTASGPVPPFSIDRLSAGGKNISIIKPTLLGYIRNRKELEHYGGSVLELLSDGKLKINIHKIYPLSDVVQAHKDLEARRTKGKLLLKL